MAHEIRDTDTIAYAGEAPWHKIGTKIDFEMTPSEALTFAKLDWTVGTRDLVAKNGRLLDDFGDDSGTQILLPVTSHKATVREDTGEILGVVGSDYCVIQNSQFTSAIDDITKHGFRVDVAGSLFGGRVIWVTGTLPGSYFVGGHSGEEIQPRLSFFTSHDGSKAHTAMASPVRIVCNNTLNMAERVSTAIIRLRHTKHAMDSDTQLNVQNALGIMTASMEQIGEIADALLNRQVSSADVDQVCAALIPDNPAAKNNTRTANNRDSIRRLFEYGQGNDAPHVRGTAWALYNGVTEYADRELTIRETPGRTADDARLASVWFGAGADLKRRALPTITKELAIC